MATLIYTNGATVVTVTAANGKAKTAFKNMAQRLGYEGDLNDDSAVAQAAMEGIQAYINSLSRKQKEAEDVTAAKNAVAADESILFDD